MNDSIPWAESNCFSSAIQTGSAESRVSGKEGQAKVSASLLGFFKVGCPRLGISALIRKKV